MVARFLLDQKALAHARKLAATVRDPITPHSGSKSSISIFLMCITKHRVLASSRISQGPEDGNVIVHARKLASMVRDPIIVIKLPYSGP